jgi:cupin fold WbuC family metalloprotein
MIPMTQRNPEVYVADQPVVSVSREEVDFLKERLPCTQRGRIRLCVHRSGEDPLHEMLIVLARRTYIRPHKHIGKSESFHMIEGMLDLVLFETNGEIREVIELGAPGSHRKFFYRLSAAEYHGLLLRTDPVVFHETTNGPFRQGDAILAPWAPEDSDSNRAAEYMSELTRRVDQFLARAG